MGKWYATRLLVAVALLVAVTAGVAGWFSARAEQTWATVLPTASCFGLTAAAVMLGFTRRRRRQPPPSGYVPVQPQRQGWRRGAS